MADREVPGATLQPRARSLGQKVPPLLVAAERVAAHLRPGLHGRRRAGSGDAFWQFRRYQPDDPASRIDWRQSARAGAPFVRETEWEAAQTVWLWCDKAPGMDWRSARGLPTKRDRAALLVLALSVALDRAAELTGLLGAESRPGAGLPTLARRAAWLEAPGTDAARTEIAGGETAGDGVPPVDPAVAPRAGLVLVGDFLAPAEAIAAAIAAYRGRGVTGHLLQVLDPAEETLPYRGRVRFEPPSGGDPLVVPRVEPLREAYRARLAAHRTALATAAEAAGWTFAVHRTDAPAEAGLAALWAALAGARGRG